MFENRTIISVCVFILTCQIILWRTYTVLNSDAIYKLDGIISDPNDGLKSPRCWAQIAGMFTENWKHLWGHGILVYLTGGNSPYKV